MRKNRFRYSTYTPTEFKNICERISPIVVLLLKKFELKEISAAEFVASYLLCVQVTTKSALVVGPKFKTKISAEFSEPATSGLKVSEILDALKVVSKPTLRNDEIVRLRPLEVFNNYSLPSIPLAANKILQQWHFNHVDLKLFFYAPDALEVMNLQAQGERLVTVFATENGAENIFIEERDPYSFTLHDLIHADLFFKDRQTYEQQVRFFKNLKNLVQNTEIKNTLSTSSEFAKKINYLASDMNSNPKHLEAYLFHTLSEYKLAHVHVEY